MTRREGLYAAVACGGTLARFDALGWLAVVAAVVAAGSLFALAVGDRGVA